MSQPDLFGNEPQTKRERQLEQVRRVRAELEKARSHDDEEGDE